MVRTIKRYEGGKTILIDHNEKNKNSLENVEAGMVVTHLRVTLLIRYCEEAKYRIFHTNT